MSKRFCTSCGTELDNDTMFCTKCGAKVEEAEDVKEEQKEKEEKKTREEKNEIVEEKKEKPVGNAPKKKGHKGLIITIILIIVIALAAFLIWFFILRDDNDKKEKDNDVIDEIIDDKNESDKNKDDKKDDDKDDKKDDEKEESDGVKEKKKFNGYLYTYSNGYGWVLDQSYLHLIDKKGKVITTLDYSYGIDNPTVIDGYSVVGNSIYNTKGEKVFTKEDTIEEMDYVGEGFVVVTIKEENYKGTTTKRGIYDLNKKEYNFEPSSEIYRVFFLEEGMFILEYNLPNSYDVKVYNTETKSSFSIGDRYDILYGKYKDGHIVYREVNSKEVYLLSKTGVKRLVYQGDSHVDLGQYNDGLVFIKDAFYDIDGNKVIDLKDEGVKGTPQFVNGYALLYFNTSYFTILSKETKEYVFEPIQYRSLGRNSGGSYEFGIFEKQTKLSESGHLLVKISGDEKCWAIMDTRGEIVYKLPVGAEIFTGISEEGYVAVDENDHDYYVNASGKKIEIDV